ncbi:hypothetical protein [Peribacillus frigoritolerans]|uniref:Uncharacterized protein n=1 Tax=Peribacillus frigoritolerans TaxID=450367 RepID=A0AAJ1VF47_9BACI|nr:hypothetical protein [Peribacillus frigoritolerans]MDM5285658.1 hypothetical protein [Peribacillus frigoritolerans]
MDIVDNQVEYQTNASYTVEAIIAQIDEFNVLGFRTFKDGNPLGVRFFIVDNPIDAVLKIVNTTVEESAEGIVEVVSSSEDLIRELLNIPEVQPRLNVSDIYADLEKYFQQGTEYNKFLRFALEREIEERRNLANQLEEERRKAAKKAKIERFLPYTYVRWVRLRIGKFLVGCIEEVNNKNQKELI